MKTERIRTADNSFTLRVPGLDEHYHSIHGAKAESMHVFIQAGLLEMKDRRELHILEVGLGTGLNCLLTLQHQPPHTKISYTAVEPFPLEESVLAELAPEDELLTDWFWQIHRTGTNERLAISPAFTLQRTTIPLQELIPDHPVDLVYFDAFAPRVQPELWTPQIFEQLFSCMSSNGLLVTYCAKGDVRRAMMQAGFQVERLPGPPHKREMLRAVKTG